MYNPKVAIRWTAEQILSFGTKPDKAVALEVGRTEFQVQYKRKRLGITAYYGESDPRRRLMTPEQARRLEQLFVDLWDLDVPARDIARVFGYRNAENVTAKANRQGLTARSKTKLRALEEARVDLARAGARARWST